jgi:hypothetical protein
MIKKGDWTCPQCDEHNFASRDKCFECGCFRSKASNKNNGNNVSTPKSGDWNCTCGNLISPLESHVGNAECLKLIRHLYLK